MKIIPLSQTSKTLKGEYVTMVDDEDFEWLNKFKWCYKKGKRNLTGYVSRGINLGNKKIKEIKLHRAIMGLVPGDKKQVDHKDGDGLNNQRNNLRVATHAQNSMNRKPRGSSKYLGVSLITRRTGKYTKPCFVASINVNKKRITLGQFPNTKDGEISAALAYNKAAFERDPQFARLNII